MRLPAAIVAMVLGGVGTARAEGAIQDLDVDGLVAIQASALGSGNQEGFAQTFADDAFVFLPGEEIGAFGPDGVLEKAHDLFHDEVTVTHVDVGFLTDGVSWVTADLSVVQSGVTFALRATELVVRTPDGYTRVRAAHFSYPARQARNYALPAALAADLTDDAATRVVGAGLRNRWSKKRYAVVGDVYREEEGPWAFASARLQRGNARCRVLVIDRAWQDGWRIVSEHFSY